MEGGIAIVLKVRISKDVRIVLDDAFDEDQIINVDGSSETDGYGDVGGKRNGGDVVLHAGKFRVTRGSGCATSRFGSHVSSGYMSG